MNEEWLAVLRGWGLPVAALVAGVAWVLVTLVNRACVHQWENQGDRMDMYPYDGADRPYKCRQAVRCSKCGKLTYFDIS